MTDAVQHAMAIALVRHDLENDGVRRELEQSRMAKEELRARHVAEVTRRDVDADEMSEEIAWIEEDVAVYMGLYDAERCKVDRARDLLHDLFKGQYDLTSANGNAAMAWRVLAVLDGHTDMGRKSAMSQVVPLVERIGRLQAEFDAKLVAIGTREAREVREAMGVTPVAP